MEKWKGERGITSEYNTVEPLHPKTCLYFTHIPAEVSVCITKYIIFPYKPFLCYSVLNRNFPFLKCDSRRTTADLLTEISACYMNCPLNQRGGNQGTAGESSFSKEVIAQILSVTESLRHHHKNIS